MLAINQDNVCLTCNSEVVLLCLQTTSFCPVGHVLVAETARLLRHTAAALQCSVLLTNHVVGAGSSFAAAAGREEGGGGGGGGRSGTGGVNSSFKPALGEQWKAAAHMRLQLSRGAGGTQDLALATLLTHPMQVSCVVCSVLRLCAGMTSGQPHSTLFLFPLFRVAAAWCSRLV